MKPIHECWLAARSQLQPEGQPLTPHEERELRRVFFIGALCLKQMQDGFKDLPAPHLAEFEAALQAELALFRATVGSALEGMV